MSKIAIKGATTGTGVFTLESPATNTDRTLTIPDVDGSIVTADASGNVGIGTSSPSELLTVSSSSAPTIRVNNALTTLTTNTEVGSLEFFTNDATSNATGISASVSAFSENTFGVDAYLSFATRGDQDASANAVERVRIDSSGNVGIGTSLPTLNTSGTVLHIDNSTASRAAAIHMTNAESGANANNGLLVGKWSDGTNYFFEYGSNPIVFGTNSLERMRIDTSGRVTMPYQPAFHYTHNNGTLTTGNIIFTNEIINRGGHYDPSNGRFTAPVAGVYYFSFHTLIQNSAGGEVRTALYRNGVGYAGLRFITIKPANQWWSVGAEGAIYLQASEWVHAVMEQSPGKIYGDANYNHFSGFLVG